MRKRKVIQISNSSSYSEELGCVCHYISALCDDGTIWVHNSENRRGWLPILDIPQPFNEEERLENLISKDRSERLDEDEKEELRYLLSEQTYRK